MAGKLVPLVLLPRYASFAGRHEHTTVPIDVTEYSKAIVTCWRGPLDEESNGATLAFIFQESSDQNTWVTCSGTNASFDPTSGLEGVAEVDLARRWFRLKFVLQSSAPYQDLIRVSGWAVGHLVQREP